jgi:hypothetical protein
MPEVVALTYFDNRVRGERFHCSSYLAGELAQKGLAREIEAHPKKAAGTKSSASPAAPASQKQTLNKSKAGRKPRRKRAASSSPTPPSE